jgi:hypothetical protein
MARVLGAAAPAILCACDSKISSSSSSASTDTTNLRSSFLPNLRQTFAAAAAAAVASSSSRVRVGISKAQAVTVAEPPRLSQVVKWQESKRIQTQVLTIGPETKTIRSLDWDRDRFDM